MRKPISVVGSGIVGIGLAVLAGWAVYSSSTSGTSTNPANQPVVVYGTR